MLSLLYNKGDTKCVGQIDVVKNGQNSSINYLLLNP